ncbi:MAG TPA: alpha/beta hydrolase [Thermoleophilaceae bacterium]|nr:alpha/beta hydrolase [Thermoleophilaceae bacterium]
MRVHFGVLLAVVGGVSSIGAAEASAALEFCERASSGRSCARLTVPLDRSGAVPGTIKLRIERQKAKRSARPPLFVIAGGPGRSTTQTFDSETVADVFGTESRSRDIVAMDQRGTGGSGALDCPALQRGQAKAAVIAKCAAKLGPRRDFYSSIDMADDIDAVREALGAERIALFGAAYGTHVALTYARRYPSRVDRLVLDSAHGPNGADVFQRTSMAAVPRVVDRLCGRRQCRSFTRDAGGDARRLATQLDRRPLVGLVTDRRGRRHRATIDGQGLLDAVAATDLTPFFGAADQIPGAIHNALRGDAAPLLRARVLGAASSMAARSERELSAATRLAALCADSLLPWTASTPFAARQASATAFVAALPATAFAPFGARTALQGEVLDACRSWPAPARQRPALGALPDVPTLLLAGGRDVRTPLANAQAIVAEMPRAKVVTVGNAGHAVLGWSFTNCPAGATRRFLAGGDPGHCDPGPRFSFPHPAPPMSLRDVGQGGGASGRAGRTAVAVQHTLMDFLVAVMGDFQLRLATADFKHPRRTFNAPFQAGALRGGAYSIPRRGNGMTFDRAVAVPGVRVHGRLRGKGGSLTGALKVSGRAAAPGRLVVRRAALRGKLGKQRVRIPLEGFIELFATDATSSSAARITRVADRLALALTRP